MKTIITIITVLLFHSAFSQKYILLDSLTAHYDTKKYTLSALRYGTDNTIEMYNFFNEDKLLLVSILPFCEKNNWEEISLTATQDKVVPIKRLFEEEISSYVRIVKKQGNKYFASRYSSIELFFIGNPKQKSFPLSIDVLF